MCIRKGLKMIIVNLCGGLGNQMFQYAFARNIQKLRGEKIILDISDLCNDSNPSRKYSLDHFVLNENIALEKSKKYKHIYDSRNIFIRGFQHISPEITYSIMSNFGVYIWDYASYKVVSILNKYKNVYLHGYWQSELYFPNCKEILQHEFQIKKPDFDKQNFELISELRSAGSVCVHIRRTDFLSPQNALMVCGNDYYIKAMEYIEHKIKNPVYYVFSDDIDDVKRNFDFNGRNVKYVGNNNPDYIELSIMAECKYFIIANSTFSWWASYLSDSDEKIIAAPSVWYNDCRDESQLKRDDMTLIENI